MQVNHIFVVVYQMILSKVPYTEFSPLKPPIYPLFTPYRGSAFFAPKCDNTVQTGVDQAKHCTGCFLSYGETTLWSGCTATTCGNSHLVHAGQSYSRLSITEIMIYFLNYKWITQRKYTVFFGGKIPFTGVLLPFSGNGYDRSPAIHYHWAFAWSGGCYAVSG